MTEKVPITYLSGSTAPGIIPITLEIFVMFNLLETEIPTFTFAVPPIYKEMIRLNKMSIKVKD